MTNRKSGVPAPQLKPQAGSAKSNKKSHFNPSSLSDALTEGFYAKNPAKHEMLVQERQALVAWLRKKGKGNKRAEALAEKLAACRPKHRCKSSACPECAEANQRCFTQLTRRYLKGTASIVCVTIAPADGAVTPGGLSTSELERFIRRTKEKLARASVEIFIGAVDWSMNESKNGTHQPFWLQHIHGLAVVNDIKATKRTLKKRFPKSPNLHRPVSVKEWDGETAAIRYVLKGIYQRRISIDNGKQFNKKTGEHRKCRDTDHQPLRTKDKLELLVHLDDIGIAGRLVLKSVQFMNLKGSGPTFVDRKSQSRNRENDKNAKES